MSGCFKIRKLIFPFKIKQSVPGVLVKVLRVEVLEFLLEASGYENDFSGPQEDVL